MYIELVSNPRNELLRKHNANSLRDPAHNFHAACKNTAWNRNQGGMTWQVLEFLLMGTPWPGILRCADMPLTIRIKYSWKQGVPMANTRMGLIGIQAFVIV